jgi:2-iminobutanoate/2-iminopropanoate deaminase
MGKKIVETDKAPQAIGPYSQANIVEAGKLLFCSGQIALDPTTGELVAGDIQAQTEQVLKNLQAVVTAAGATLHQVVKTTVYLRNMDEFQSFNKVYEHYFTDIRPARATVEVSRLPKDAVIEIDAIAYLE